MKYKILFLMIINLLSGVIFAQSRHPAQKYVDKTVNKDGFLSVNIGNAQTFGDDSWNVFGEFKEANGYDFNVTGGYIFHRLVGVRGQTHFLKGHNRINKEVYDAYKDSRPELVPDKGFYSYNVLQTSAEIMVNISNWFLPERKTHKWNFYYFCGPNVTLTYNYDKSVVEPWKTLENGRYIVDDDPHWMWGINMGFTLERKVSRHLGINAEVRCSFTGDNLEGVESEEFYDAIMTHSLGLTYHF